ncbi:hypothetical protein [Micromonospora rubida]|uniref:hypothetical protein n=1 Tax=Micromonospora rubida TaxID=2697657 RepID=UPI00137836CB|nr:hypothetical protein [Micromonospora rubida]NBE80034.1 hypothetical protein [Micromonospora rubida]
MARNQVCEDLVTVLPRSTSEIVVTFTTNDARDHEGNGPKAALLPDEAYGCHVARVSGGPAISAAANP